MVELKIQDIKEIEVLKSDLTIDSNLSLTAGKELYKEITGDYEKLENLPYLDNQKIIGKISERDPTVPIWAKTKEKPIYTSEEIGIESISLEELNNLFEEL